MGSGGARRGIVTSLEVLVYVLLAGVAVVAVGSGVSGTVNSWRAQHDGEVGTFTPVEQHCGLIRGATLCAWTGTWESDAGDQRVEDVLLDEDLGAAEGDPPPDPVHPVLHHDAYSDPRVVHRPGDRTWLLAPVVSAAVLGGVGCLSRRMHRWSRQHRLDVRGGRSRPVRLRSTVRASRR
jgi:hypothetical protein